MKFLFFVLVVVATVVSCVSAQKCKNGDIVDLTPGRSCLFGYNFDGPIERGLWRSIWWTKSLGKVTDCNSYCKYRTKKGGKCCPSAGEDKSTWCNGKNSCTCGSC
uniref:Uncharacterized protein n=1 Tax=Panagrolaimus superbus TaxID=310955 RepID=A0A914YC43_9BILA